MPLLDSFPFYDVTDGRQHDGRGPAADAKRLRRKSTPTNAISDRTAVNGGFSASPASARPPVADRNQTTVWASVACPLVCFYQSCHGPSGLAAVTACKASLVGRDRLFIDVFQVRGAQNKLCS